MPKIIISLEDDMGSVIAKRETGNFEVAEQNLDSLKRHWCEIGFRKHPRNGDEVMSEKDANPDY